MPVLIVHFSALPSLSSPEEAPCYVKLDNGCLYFLNYLSCPNVD